MKRFPIESISPSSADACAAEILEVIPAVMRTIRTRMRQHSEALPSVVHFRALAYINRNPDSDITGLAAHIGLLLPSASKLVQVLLTRGYVARSPDPADRRRTLLRPTPRGRKVVEAARGATRQYLAQLLQDCDAPTRQRIASAMHALRPIFAPDAGNTPAAAARPPHDNGNGSHPPTSAARRGRAPRRTPTRTTAS